MTWAEPPITAAASAAIPHRRNVSYEYKERFGNAVRRAFAKLAHKGRAALEQIQLSLGHASIVTTEKYLGTKQDLQNAPCDALGLRLPSI